MDLIKENYIVSFPLLPNRDNPDFEQWKGFVKEEITHFKPDIVVCHSLGNVVFLHVFNEMSLCLDKVLLVAPVSQECNIEEIKAFFPYPLPLIDAHEVLIKASTNDPYMSLDEVKQMQIKMDISLEILQSAGHINADSGFGKLDCALQWIQKEIK
jgi:predicted alpha/beta hydrolase family esterase